MQRGVEATIKGFNTIDYNFLRATRSDDFLYQFLPLSLGQPARNNDEYKLFFDAVFPMYKKFIVRIIIPGQRSFHAVKLMYLR